MNKTTNRSDSQIPSINRSSSPFLPTESIESSDPSQIPSFIENIYKEFQNYQLYKEQYEYILKIPIMQHMIGKIEKLEK